MPMQMRCPNSHIDLVVLAAGKATRMDRDVPKQFLDLCGKPVIIRSLEVFESISYIGTKYIIVAKEQIDRAKELLDAYSISNAVVVQGGDTRLKSVMEGLKCVKTRRVMIHLATIPFVTCELVARLVQFRDKAVIPTIKPGPTISQGTDIMQGELERDHLRIIQTPQLFDTATLRQAHHKAVCENATATEDGQMVFRLGVQVRFIEGLYRSVDIKSPLDLAIAQKLIEENSRMSLSKKNPQDMDCRA